MFLKLLCYLFSLKNNKRIITFYLVIIASIFNHSLNAQQILDYSFVLDTTQTQIFPYDLKFPLKLVDSEDARIKYVYLIRINNKGKIVFDKQTSLYRIGQKPRAKHNILQKVYKSQEFIEKNNDSLDIWEDLKNKNEGFVKIEADAKKKALLKNEIELYKANISKFVDKKNILDSFSKNPNEYIKDGKGEFMLEVLDIKGRDRDTLIVEVKPLRPGKDYLILAVNETNKITALKELVQKYLNGESIDDEKVEIIPRKYLYTKTIDSFKLDYKLKKDKGLFKIEKGKKVNPNFVEFEIKSEDFVAEFEKAKKDKIDSLLRLSKFNITELQSYTGKITSPGEFKYAVISMLHDSITKIIPEDYNNDFRRINGIISEFESFGDSLVSGSYVLEKSESNDYRVNFNPNTSLSNRLNTINDHINMVLEAEQSLFILAESDINRLDAFKTYFSDLIRILSQNRDIMVNKVNSNTKVNTILASVDLPYGLQTKSINNSTFTHDFLTRNSGVIKQSFGLLYYFSNNGGFSGAAPYTGVDYQIRATNENTNFWKIPGLKKFFSLQLGVPVFASQLTDGDQRRHLFGDNFSLYTGIGINIGHSIKIGYGAVLFRSIDSNSIATGDPSFKIDTLHAFTLGVNFRLLPLFRNIFGSSRTINFAQ